MKDKTKTELHPALLHLQNRPALNLSYFARELGVDPSNFKKMVAGKAGIKEEVVCGLEELLGAYGYRKHTDKEIWDSIHSNSPKWIKVEDFGKDQLSSFGTDIVLGINRPPNKIVLCLSELTTEAAQNKESKNPSEFILGEFHAFDYSVSNAGDTVENVTHIIPLSQLLTLPKE